MSTTSPQAKAADENAAWQAQLSKMLSEITMPEFQRIMGENGMFSKMLGGVDSAGRLPQDAANLAASTDFLNRGYEQANFGIQQGINYGGLRSGEGRMSPGAVNASMGAAATTLERQRQGALSNLNFMSAQSSMADYNKLLGLMGQGIQSSLGLAQGFSGASNAAIGGLSQQTQMGSTIAGLGSGAALGATIGSIIPGVGTVIGGAVGGIAGGAAGYFGGA